MEGSYEVSKNTAALVAVVIAILAGASAKKNKPTSS